MPRPGRSQCALVASTLNFAFRGMRFELADGVTVDDIKAKTEATFKVFA